MLERRISRALIVSGWLVASLPFAGCGSVAQNKMTDGGSIGGATGTAGATGSGGGGAGLGGNGSGGSNGIGGSNGAGGSGGAGACVIGTSQVGNCLLE